MSDGSSRKQSRGAILSIVGPPGSGKSYVSKKLAKHYQAVLLLEKIDKFPRRIRANLEKRTRLLETFLWFRNDEILRQYEAAKVRARGQIAILDTFWLSSQLFLRGYRLDPFELRVALEIARLDSRQLSWPDIVIYLRAHRIVTQKYVANRVSKRPWERTRLFRESAEYADSAHRRYFESHAHAFKLITLDDRHADYKRTRDFDELVAKIDSALQPTLNPADMICTDKA